MCGGQAFTAITFCISTLIQVAVGALLPKYTNFASGPYGLIFAMMVLAFYRVLPNYYDLHDIFLTFCC